MKNSFGKTKASLRLEKLVSNNRSARRKVSSLLSEFTMQMMAIMLARDSGTVRLCLKLLRQHTINRIDIIKSLNNEIKMYTKNVVIGRYRAYLNGFNQVAIARSEQERKCLTSDKKGV